MPATKFSGGTLSASGFSFDAKRCRSRSLESFPSVTKVAQTPSALKNAEETSAAAASEDYSEPGEFSFDDEDPVR